MRYSGDEKTISPSKAGNIYGKFIPSPVTKVKVRVAAKAVKEVPMTRARRRRLQREAKKTP